MGRLYHLNAQQLNFVETFVRCEGKINRVEKEMGMSYPAVRARLTEVIRALGYDVQESAEETLTAETRQDILSQIAEGKLSAEEALELLGS